MSRPIITLTTDFGQADGYVGTMKGVILGICPEAALVDISHEIRPQAVRQAAYVLSAAATYFPPDTVHLVVVDPGVGGKRRPIAVQAERATYVAPDNGVLSTLLARDPARLAVHLTKRRYRLPRVSVTFHGRDIFAPAAAHLALGTDPRQMGEPIPLAGLVDLPAPQPEVQPDGSWQGEVLHIDRFGNLITNIQVPISCDQLSVEAGGAQIVGLSRTFADVQSGALVAYVGSSGYLEIAVREGNAAARLNTDVGDRVRVVGPLPPMPSVTEGGMGQGRTREEQP
jgi:S-adenosylmethionine hydrolase